MPAVLETRDLKKHYQMGATAVRALDGVSWTVHGGEFVGAARAAELDPIQALRHD